MRTNVKKIICGVILLLLAVALIAVSVSPLNTVLSSIPWWKWVVAALLTAWLVRNTLFGHSWVDRCDVFLPLGCLFIVFEREIGTACGLGERFINHWVILVACGLMTAGLHLIGESRKKAGTPVSGEAQSNSHTFVHVDDGKSIGTEEVIFDAATAHLFSLDGKSGVTTVRFAHMDTVPTGQQIRLDINRCSGVITVNIPEKWDVKQCIQSSGIVSTKSKTASAAYDRTFLLTGTGNSGIITVTYEN